MRYSGIMPMYYGAKPELFEFAKRMRQKPTEAGGAMWKILISDEFLQYKFRRQHPIFKFIADFYSHSLLLVVEIDGGYHQTAQQKELDKIRDEDMQQLRLNIIRFTNDEIVQQPQTAIEKLKKRIAELITK